MTGPLLVAACLAPEPATASAASRPPQGGLGVHRSNGRGFFIPHREGECFPLALEVPTAQGQAVGRAASTALGRLEA